MRVLSVVGNRPQFIKSAPVSVALRDSGIDEVVVHTGQHYDPELSQVFFDELGLSEPKHRLGLQTADPDVMRPRILDAIRAERPDIVLVYGDTNSTLAGTQASATADKPVAHVEAGLRSGDLTMPEERNRIQVDRISALLFAPDDRSRETLESEGVNGQIEVVGDVMADVCFRVAPIARERSDVLARLGIEPWRYVAATVHREANVQPRRLARILEGLGAADVPVILAAHPRTRATIEREDLGVPGNVNITKPLGYLDFAALVSQSRVVATDSGGLQKESFWYGVPCVTLRSSTEWIDTIEAGGNILVDDDPQAIAEAIRLAAMPMGRPELYGDGSAAPRIAQALLGSLSRA